MKILLITGSSGFIGQNFLNFINLNYSNKYNIVLLSSSKNTKFITINHKDYKFTKEDFINQNIKRIDIVLHLGAFTPKSSDKSNNLEKSNENIINTKYLMDNLPNIPEKFIFASTLDVYGQIDTKIDESSKAIPLTMYGWSKLYCEKMIENWADKHSVICQVLRFGHIYGKGENAYKKIIPVTIQKLKDGENPQIFGKGTEKRSFLHVDDVCNLIMESINLDKYEGVINLCSSQAHSIKEIIAILLEISNDKNLQIDYVESQNKPIDLTFNTDKMNLLLGYETVDIEKGLREEYYAV